MPSSQPTGELRVEVTEPPLFFSLRRWHLDAYLGIVANMCRFLPSVSSSREPSLSALCHRRPPRWARDRPFILLVSSIRQTVVYRPFFCVASELLAAVNGATTSSLALGPKSAEPAVPLHPAFRWARARANSSHRECKPSQQSSHACTVFILLAWWRHHDITHTLWPFFFRKINPEIL
jgi:hypothetical protein